MELLAPFTLLLGAMFSLANVRQAKIAQRENTIDLPQSFKVACRAKPFWTMFLSLVLEGLIFLAGIILIGVASVMLGVIGYVVCLFVNTVEPLLIILVFLAPGMLVTLVYCIIMPILFAPTAYIIETNPEIGAADAISICFNTMKSRGKITYFLNLLIPAIVEGAIIGLCVATEIVLAIFISDIRLAVTLAVLVGLIFFVAFALVAPMFALARKISNQSLFEDIVLDPVNASKRTSGVNIRKCKGVKFDPAEYENELSLLFDETYSDRTPVPENPALKRQREREKRQAVREVSQAYTQPTYSAPADGEEEDGKLLTVSDLIRDVETPSDTVEPVKSEQPATEPAAETKEEPTPAVEPDKAEEVPAVESVKTEEPVAAEPMKEPAPVQAEETVKVEEPVTATVEEPIKTEEPTAPAEKSAKAEDPATVEKPEEEPTEAAEEPAEKPVKKTTAAKTTVKVTTKVAAKPATKTTAAKTATAKTATTVKAKTAEKSTTKTTTTVKAKAKPADGGADK